MTIRILPDGVNALSNTVLDGQAVTKAGIMNSSVEKRISVTLIVSTYNQPTHLVRRNSTLAMQHIWHRDDGFRKTIILNKAILATDADYLIFIDGDILVRPDFIDQHLRFAKQGRYLSGSIIRLNARELISVNRQF